MLSTLIFDLGPYALEGSNVDERRTLLDSGPLLLLPWRLGARSAETLSTLDTVEHPVDDILARPPDTDAFGDESACFVSNLNSLGGPA